MKNFDKYMLMSLTAHIIFGFSFLFSRLAMDVAEPFVLLSIRFIVAFAVLQILVSLKVIDVNLKGRDIKPLILLGLIQPVAYFIFESYGIKMTSSSFSGVIIALVPIVALLPTYIFLKEKPTIMQIVCSVFSVAGVIILTLNDEFGTFSFLGFMFLLGAVITAIFFNILGRKIKDEYNPYEKTYVMFLLSAVIFTIIALIKVKDIGVWTSALSSYRFWISIAYLSIASSIGAFILINKALVGLEVNRNLICANVTTVISVLAGVIFLKEKFTLIQFVAIVVVLLGVYGVNKYTK